MPPIVPAARRNSSAAERRRAKKKRKRAAEEADDLPPGFAAFAAEAAAGGADSDEEDGGAREPDELDEEAAAVQSVDGLDDESEGGASGGSVAAAGGGEEEEEEGREALLAQLLSPELLSLSLSEWRAESGLEILASADRPDKADRLAGWLLAPLSPAQFEEEVRERRPLHISRSADRAYHRGWFGSEELRQLLRDGDLKYTDGLDVTRYTVEGGRATLNGEGAATAEEVLAAFEGGCSVRLSWPQRHSDTVWGLLASLEEHFGCGAGCNVYYTPAGSQGFAPHYDDVDVFILQVEGEKRWTLHAPPAPEHVLPRDPSPDFAPADLGPPLASVALKPGDLLYLPRGTVHQAFTPAGGAASLHLTVSISRRHTWRDLLELGLAGALEEAAAADVTWRRALPREYESFMGVLHSDRADARRAQFSQMAHGLLQRLVASMPLDAVADQFAGRGWMYDRMPPHATPDDARRLARAGSLSLASKVRLRSRSAARLAVEGDVAVLYHHGTNTRAYHEVDEPQHIDFDLDAAPALEQLLASYPKYVRVGALPCETAAQRLDVANALAEAHLILVKPGEQPPPAAKPKQKAGKRKPQ